MGIDINNIVFVVISISFAFSILCHGKSLRSFVPGSDKEQNLISATDFKYDAKTHLIMTRTSRHYEECFVYNTTIQERTDVHTELGIRTIEAKIMGMITQNRNKFVPLPRTAVQALGQAVNRFCSQGKPVYRLN